MRSTLEDFLHMWYNVEKHFWCMPEHETEGIVGLLQNGHVFV